MQNTVRVRKNSATKCTASQVQTIEVKPKFGPEFGLSKTSLFDELDHAKAQSYALHLLLFDTIRNQDDGTYSEEIQLGITELIIKTHERLDRACAAVSGQNSEVAS